MHINCIRAMQHPLKGSLWLCVAYQQHERQGVSYTEGFCHLLYALICFAMKFLNLDQKTKSNNILYIYSQSGLI